MTLLPHQCSLVKVEDAIHARVVNIHNNPYTVTLMDHVFFITGHSHPSLSPSIFTYLHCFLHSRLRLWSKNGYAGMVLKGRSSKNNINTVNHACLDSISCQKQCLQTPLARRATMATVGTGGAEWGCRLICVFSLKPSDRTWGCDSSTHWDSNAASYQNRISCLEQFTFRC